MTICARLRLAALVVLAVLAAAPAPAQPLTRSDGVVLGVTSGPSVRAALRFGGASADVPGAAARVEGGRSIPLAAAASAVVPGLGQAYNRDWIKAAAGLAIEAALVYGYVSSRQRGLDGEEAYIDYAHQYWDPAKYARWLEDYTGWLGDVERQTIAVPGGVDFQNPDVWTPEQARTVRAFFDEIRRAEDAAYHENTGASFSHSLPYFSEQQYYELIGKYPQFAPGWSDYPAWTSGADGEADPAAIDPDDWFAANRGGDARFFAYARDHAHANDLLRQASRISSFIFLNHLAAAIEAAVSAKLHNDRLGTDLGFAPGASGTLSPRAALSWRW